MENRIKYKMMNIHEKINFRSESVQNRSIVEAGTDFMLAIGLLTLGKGIKLEKEEIKTIRNVTHKFIGIDKNIYKQLKLS